MTFTRAGVRFDVQRIESNPFSHFIFKKIGCTPGVGERIFVFIDGDGNSWIDRGRVSDDPTPQIPIALDLLAADESCGIYLARPCTFGLASTDPGCEPVVWTLDRYSARVIESLEGALLQVAPRDRALVLVGYSGGGLLATHLANRIPSVEGVITLAANLDLEAWVEHHGYVSSMFARSEVAPFPMRANLAQLHVVGARDRVSPASLVLDFLQRDERANELVLEDADHICCWVREWPVIRERILRLMDESGPTEAASPGR